jgi:hypothetical protein
MTPTFDRKVAQQFIETIVEPWPDQSLADAVFEVRCLGENRAIKSDFFTTSEIEKAVHFAERENNNRLNTYVTVNPLHPSVKDRQTAARDADVLSTCYVFADADDLPGFENLTKFVAAYPPDIIVETGSHPTRRRHAYWRPDEPITDLILWNVTQKLIANALSTDKAVVNPSRIMRLAGSVSYPSAKKLELGYMPETVKLLVEW